MQADYIIIWSGSAGSAMTYRLSESGQYTVLVLEIGGTGMGPFIQMADSPIFPRVTNCNLNAPSIMVGEKASDHILGNGMLHASNQTPWLHPSWETSVKKHRAC